MRFFLFRETSLLLLYGAVAGVAVTLPAAVDISASQSWDGNDGPWSSFTIFVGTPEQQLRVFLSTAATTTWVVGTQACNYSFVPANCSTVRGGTFDNETSTSWVRKGDYLIQVEAYLGYDNFEGEYGWDTVQLGFQGSGGPTLNHTMVTWIEDEDFLVGMFGLNPRPSNFSLNDTNHSLNDTEPSYLSMLYEQRKIPSLTYSYTAGAKYRFDGVLGSLMLGGYDKGLFVENDVDFNFFSDQSYDLTVGLQAITISNSAREDLLASEPILAFIDSTESQIWLPLVTCQAFEQVFGLVYDNTTDLYLLNDTQHAALLAQNSSITFSITPLLESPPSQQVSITLPYAAFDLEVSWGYTGISTPTRYFPLRRAVNGTRAVLGRTFLQEAYLTVDYDNSNFSVSQRSWTFPQKSDVQSIFSNATLSWAAKQNSSKLHPGIIAAIAVAGVVIISLIFGTWFFLRLRRKRLQEKKRKEEEEIAARKAEHEETIVGDPYATPPGVINEIYTEKWEPPELHGKHFFNGAEVDGSHASEQRYELGKGMESIEGRHELEAPHGTGELNGSGSRSSTKSVEGTGTATGTELKSPSEPVSPESTADGNKREPPESASPVSPQSPDSSGPMRMRNDRHLVYGFIS